MFDFSQQVVLITGGSGNLGSAVARKFVAAGAQVVLVDRETELLQRLFPELAASPDHMLAQGVNVLDEGQMRETVSAALDRFRQLDVLVNTVGGYRGGTPLHETPLEMWDFMLNLNARSVVVASQAVVPAMLQRGYGKIVNVAARAAQSGGANRAAYSAAKSAVVSLTESLSAELKGSGINVNCILPGTIDTPENRQERPNADFSRWVTPEALTDVILFLASDAARAVHGAAVPVYGLS